MKAKLFACTTVGALLLTAAMATRAWGQGWNMLDRYKITHYAELNWPNYPFTGDSVKPRILFVERTVGESSVVLRRDTDFVFSFANCTDANHGTDSATVTATGIGRYFGTISANYYVVPRALTDASITVAAMKRVSFTGGAVKPNVSVTFKPKNEELSLVEGTDYIVSYHNNVNLGRATFTLTGRGNFSGQRTDTFEIIRNIFDSGMVISPIAVQAWTGSAVQPSISIRDSLRNRILTPGTDYVLSYENNVDVGWAWIFISGKGDYSGVACQRFFIYFSGNNPPHINKDKAHVIDMLLPGTSHKMMYYYGEAGMGEFFNVLQEAFNNAQPDGKVTLPEAIEPLLKRYNNSDSTVKSLIGDVEPYLEHIGRDRYYLKFSFFPEILQPSHSADSDSDSDSINVGAPTTIIPPPYANHAVADIIYYTGSGFRYSGYANLLNMNNELLEEVTQVASDQFSQLVDNGWQYVTVGDNRVLVVDGRIWSDRTPIFRKFSDSQIGEAEKTLNRLRYERALRAARQQAVEKQATEEYSSSLSSSSSSISSLPAGAAIGANPGNNAVGIGIGITVGGAAGVALIVYLVKMYSLKAEWVQFVHPQDSQMVYTGQPLTPPIRVMENKNSELIAGTDYTVTYGNNINQGRAEVKVAGKGLYRGTVGKTFHIVPDTLDNDFRIIPISPQVWTGHAIIPQPPVAVINVHSGDTVNPSHYNVTYDHNTYVSSPDSKAIVRATGRGNYTNTLETHFTIYAEITARVKEYNRHNHDTVHFYKNGSRMGADIMPLPGVFGSNQYTQDITASDTALLQGEWYKMVITRPAHLSVTIDSISVRDSSIVIGIMYENTKLFPIELPCGDVNGDNIINQQDTAIIRRYLGTSITDNNRNCDLNGDSSINDIDIEIWNKFYDTKKDTLPVYISFQNPDSVTSAAAQSDPAQPNPYDIGIGGGIQADPTFNVRNDTLISVSNAVGNVTIPSNLGIKVIGRGAFNRSFTENTTTLTGIVIPEGVIRIDESAFWNCTALTSVSLPNTLKTIGNGAFWYCSALTNITLPDGLTTLEHHAFESTGLTSIIIPNSVTSIGNSVFAYTALTSINIPNSVTTLGEATCYSCGNLTTAIVGDGVERIDGFPLGNFIHCPALQTLVLGTGMKNMSANPFYDCPALNTLVIRTLQPPTISITDSWNLPANARLYIPQTSEAAYRNDNVWNTWTGAIIADIPTGRLTAYSDTILLRDTTHLRDTAFAFQHDTIHDTTFQWKDTTFSFQHDTIHDTTFQWKDTAFAHRDTTLHDTTLNLTTITDTLHILYIHYDTIRRDTLTVIDTTYIFPNTVRDTFYEHIEMSRTDTTWHTADAIDTATALFYDTTHTHVSLHDTTHTTLVLVDPTLPPAQLLLHDTLLIPHDTQIPTYLLIDPLADIGTGIFIAPSSETRASAVAEGILLEGLTPAAPFALYSIDGLLLLRDIAPATGAYLLRELSPGTYLLHHAGKWSKFVHK